MDYGALPPEVNSGRMYAGPGAGPMLAAASAWDGLSAELQSTASSYGSVISALTSGPWEGPSSAAMAAAAAPYVAWINTTAEQAELVATQAKAAAGAYTAAFAATVPPAEVAANRAQLISLVTTNLFGQNTPAIAATEAQYGEMWAQDAAAMYGYAASSAAATSQVTPLTAAPQTTNTASSVAQPASAAQSAVSGVQSTLSQLISEIQTALQKLASPLLSAFSDSSSSSSSTISLLGGTTLTTSGGLSLPNIETALIEEYGAAPEWLTIGLVNTGVGTTFGPLLGSSMGYGFQQLATANAAAAAAAAAAPAAAGSAFTGGVGGFPGLGSLAGIGQAASVGGLSVPAGWGWAATAPPGLLGQAPMLAPAAAALPLAGDDLASGLGFPIPLGGLGRTAAAGVVGAVAGAAGAKYLPRLSVVARSPAAGYSAEPTVSVQKYPMPATFPTNGHAPPGYEPAIVYVPTNGHAQANV